MNPQPALHVVLSENVPPTWGGVARVAYNLAYSLVQAGYDTLLCGFDRYVSDPLYARESIAVLPIPSARWKQRKDWAMARLLWRIHARTRGRPVILYALTWKLARVARYLAPLLGWRLVVFAHGLEVTRQLPGFRLSGYKRRAMLGVFRHADLCLGVSRYTADLLVRAGVPAERVRVLNNGVDTRVFHPPVAPEERAQVQALRRELGGDDGILILTLARVIERKGQDTVIRALARLAAAGADAPRRVRYAIAGRGPAPEVARLRELARQLGIEDAVLFWGYVAPADMRLFYNACDIYVMDSRIVSGTDVEGFGITFLEAAACGKPVIGGRSGGVADAIEDGKSGFLVDPDDVGELADRLRLLMENPDRRAAMGAYGLRRVREELGLHAVTERLLGMLHDLPEGHGVAGSGK